MTNKIKIISNRDGYNHWSSFYDDYINPTVAADELNFPAYWKHLTGQIILEIGCGTGRHTKKLLSQKNQVTGIDLSSGMLDIARQKLHDLPAKLIEADFLTYLGFKPNSFDSVISALVIEHIQDLRKFFEKVGLILKPGGELYLSELHPTRGAQGSLAHFKDLSSEDNFYLESFVHADKTIQSAAAMGGLQLIKSREIQGDEILTSINSAWKKYLGIPMIQVRIFRKV